jgi:hypothetical protein
MNHWSYKVHLLQTQILVMTTLKTSSRSAHSITLISIVKVKVKVKLSLCLTKHTAMKTYWGTEVQLHAVTSALEGI